MDTNSSDCKQMRLLRRVSKLKHGLFPKGILSLTLSAGINQIRKSEDPSPRSALRAELLISHTQLGVSNSLFFLKTLLCVCPT